MPALDLGPANRLPALGAGHFDRPRVRKLLEVSLERTSEQHRFRLVGAARLASKRGVNLRRES